MGTSCNSDRRVHDNTEDEERRAPARGVIVHDEYAETVALRTRGRIVACANRAVIRDLGGSWGNEG